MGKRLAALLLAAAVADATDCTIATQIGCFNDEQGGEYNTSNRVLQEFLYNSHNTQAHGKMTQELCAQVCNERGYALAGVEATYQCFCGDAINPQKNTRASGCQEKCQGNSAETCGGYWRMQVFNYTCTGPPTGGAPIAIMSNCSDGADEVTPDDVLWNWNNNDLLNPEIGSSICLEVYPTECLAAEANHEHAWLIVTRNADKWYWNQTDFTLRRAPDNKLAFAINCNFLDGCNHDGANLFVSSPYAAGSHAQVVKYNSVFNAEDMMITSDNSAFHQCLSVGCFTRGKGTSTPGGNCAIYGGVKDASACQMKCQGVGCCQYWNYHTGDKRCVLKYDQGWCTSA
jgi:hypothetical protein